MNAVFKVFQEIIDLQTILGENQFRIRAYSNALKVMKGIGTITDVSQVQSIKGFGDRICTAVEQVLSTGTCDKLDELRKKAPPATVAQFQKIPGVGPKGALRLFQDYAVATLEELDSLIETGAIGVQKYKNGVKFALRASERTPIGFVLPRVTPVLERIKQLTLVDEAEFAGSLRRRKETIRDIDILVSVNHYSFALDVLKLRRDVVEAVQMEVGEVEVEAQGERKLRCRDLTGLQIDVLFVPSLEYGAALQYFTGSKEHNIELRKRAIDRGWKLNEKGLFDGDGGDAIASTTEHGIYSALGIPMLPPELRQDGTEVGKSAPKNLIQLSDLTGTLHNHTDWSDGRASIGAMTSAAALRGHKYIAITDHTKAMAIARGLSEQKWLAQRERVESVRAQMRMEDTRQHKIEIYHSAEMDVLQDGTCDYPLDLIREMDFILLALHRQPQKDICQRFTVAVDFLRNSLGFDKTIILAHPTGRQFGKSEIPDLLWNNFFAVMKACDVVLEINSMPSRLDLPDYLCKMAKERHGLKFSISTDSHDVSHFDFLEFGINVARRGWLEKDDVINTREKLFA